MGLCNSAELNRTIEQIGIKLMFIGEVIEASEYRHFEQNEEEFFHPKIHGTASIVLSSMENLCSDYGLYFILNYTFLRPVFIKLIDLKYQGS